MARVSAFTAGLVLGLALGTAVLVGHADDVSAEVQAAAVAAGVDPVKLQGAVNSTGEDPWLYLRGVGELDSPPSPAPRSVPPPLAPAVSARVACIIRVESRGDPTARNRSGASGLGQFLPSTWASTPQGKAGLSVFNPAANTAAIAWMVDNGRAREFDAVRYGGC
jgi:Transglycosylase SLT domain